MGLVLFVCFYQIIEEYTEFKLDDFVHVDGSKQDDGYKHVDTKQRKGHSTLLNIYGEPLQPCRDENSKDRRGSWNSNGYCDETGGGVHQICLSVDKTPDFSHHTKQGRWSDKRKGKNHCMCLGAWALYKARQENNEIPKTNDELNCESIMDDSLDESYVGKWNRWNGHELSNQIVHGVNELYQQCYQKGNDSQKKHLKNIYNNLTESRSEFHNTNTYQTHSV